MLDLDKPRERMFLAILLGAAILLIGRLFMLQVVQGLEYRHVSEQNAAKNVPIFAPRGLITDRYGKLLVGNKAIFAVYLMPNLSEEEKANSLGKLAITMNLPISSLSSAVAENMDASFIPILIKDDLPVALAAKIQERQNDLPGIFVRWRSVRSYPYGSVLAHVLGYVGEASQDDVLNHPDGIFKAGDYLGKDGIEKYYDEYLRGIDGGQKIEVDVRGRPKKITEASEPVPGNNLQLTIDLEMQKVVEKLLDGHEGAIVVINPQNGEVLALASRPTFNPEIFAHNISPSLWQALDRGHPFMNRALGIYPPGSTFKPITLAATLQQNAWPLNQLINCPGYLMIGARKAKCWKETGHGNISILEGLVWSCDVVFYTLGMKIGPEAISKMAGYFGLGTKTQIDLPQEKNGTIPNADWKKKVYNVGWFPGDSANMATGQGFNMVTPIQMAVYYGALGTGNRWRPFVMKQVVDREGKVLLKGEPTLIAKIPLAAEIFKLIRDSLTAVVSRGTGQRAKVDGLPAAGKTGTAENPGLPHAWFVSYAPTEKPEIAMAVFIAHGMHGDQVSAQITGDFLRWYKENRLTREI